MSKQQRTITGIIKEMGDVETVGVNSRQKRRVEIHTESDYPEIAFIDFWGDKIGLLDKFGVGESATIYFNLNGNKFNGKCFNSLNGYKIEAN